MKNLKRCSPTTLLLALMNVLVPMQSAHAAERCNTFTANSCFGVDWTTVTEDQITLISSHTRDSNGRTPLHWAASRTSDPAVINALLDAGANIHAKDMLEYTPLHAAVEGIKSDKGVIDALLQAGAQVKSEGDSSIAGTPLHVAAVSNEPWVIEALLEVGADPNAGDFDNMTALHTAGFANPNTEVLTVLLKAGADVNASGKVGSRAQQAGYTPLHAAAKGTRNPEVIHTLINAGAALEDLNRDGYTPLHIAADANRTPAVIRVMIDSGARINAINDEGFTPLHAAAYTNFPEMLEILIEAGAEVNALSSDGLTPLHIAAIGNADPAVIAALITSGAETHVKDMLGKTPYDYAKKNKLLRETDGDGYRMLELAQ